MFSDNAKVGGVVVLRVRVRVRVRVQAPAPVQVRVPVHGALLAHGALLVQGAVPVQVLAQSPVLEVGGVAVLEAPAQREVLAPALVLIGKIYCLTVFIQYLIPLLC